MAEVRNRSKKPAKTAAGRALSRRASKANTHMSLRYIMRLTEDGYEAWCVDAGAVGIGDTQLESLGDLIVNLEALYRFTVESGHTMLTTATEDEERLIARMAGGQTVDPDVLGYGVVRLVETKPAAKGKGQRALSPSGFQVSLHTLVAA